VQYTNHFYEKQIFFKKNEKKFKNFLIRPKTAYFCVKFQTMCWVKTFKWYCFLALFMFSCLHDSKLERALQLAGANRHELESVISYYETRGVRQKLEAARYHIINMPHLEY